MAKGDVLKGWRCLTHRKTGVGAFEATGCQPIRAEAEPITHHECGCMTSNTEARTKSVVFGEIQAAAKQMQEANPSLTIEQAIAKVTDSNPRLYTEYTRAEDDAPTPPPAAEGYQFGTAEKVVFELIEKKASEFMQREPSLTREQARVKVMTEFPESLERYRKAQEVDRISRTRR